MHKSKTKDQDENDAKLWGIWLSLVEVKLHEIKSLGAITGAIKRNWKNRDWHEIC
jgi:hypothetical protein